MNFRTELKKLQKHREKYYPVLCTLASLHSDAAAGPLDLTNHADVILVLEMLDTEYLRHEAFVVRSRFGTISQVQLVGPDPLSVKGKEFLRNAGISLRLRTILGSWLRRLAGKRGGDQNGRSN